MSPLFLFLSPETCQVHKKNKYLAFCGIKKMLKHAFSFPKSEVENRNTMNSLKCKHSTVAAFE